MGQILIEFQSALSLFTRDFLIHCSKPFEIGKLSRWKWWKMNEMNWKRKEEDDEEISCFAIKESTSINFHLLHSTLNIKWLGNF